MGSPDQNDTSSRDEAALAGDERAALRGALAEGEASGPAGPFDFDAFLAFRIAAGEASYQEHGGRPVAEAFAEIRARLAEAEASGVGERSMDELIEAARDEARRRGLPHGG